MNLNKTLVVIFTIAILCFLQASEAKSRKCGQNGVCRLSNLRCKKASGICPTGFNCCRKGTRTAKKTSNVRRKCARTKRKCSNQGGTCQNPNQNACLGMSVHSLCKGASCSCCISGSGRLGCTSNPSCSFAGGVCVRARKASQWCLNATIDEDGCEGRKCVCCTPQEMACSCGMANLRSTSVETTTQDTPVPTTEEATTEFPDGPIIPPVIPPIIPPKPKTADHSIRQANETSVIVPSKFPWLVGIDTRPFDGVYECSATIINTIFVATSASCVENLRRRNIRVGVADPSNPGSMKNMKIARTFIHEDFSSDTLENNLALVQLKKPLDFLSSDETKPVCLPTTDDDDYEGRQAVAAGWSTSDTESQRATEMNATVLGLDCDGATTVGSADVTEETLCAMTTNQSSQVAASGEPLMVEEDGRYILAGIMSDLDGETKLYTRSSKYSQWISDTVAGEGSFCG